MQLHFELNDGAAVDLHSYNYGKFLILSKKKCAITLERVDKLTDQEILQLAIKMVGDYEQSTNADAVPTPCYFCAARNGASATAKQANG